MAVTSTPFTAVPTAWTDLGIGPFEAVTSSPRNLFRVADVVPSGLTIGGFRIVPEFSPWFSTTTSHLWVIGDGFVTVSQG